MIRSYGGGGGGVLINGNGPGSPGYGGGEGDFYAPGTSHPARPGVIIFEIAQNQWPPMV